MATTEDHTAFTYVAPDVIDHAGARGHMEWRWGDRIEWHVAAVDGEIVGRRRTRGELVELLRNVTAEE